MHCFSQGYVVKIWHEIFDVHSDWLVGLVLLGGAWVSATWGAHGLVLLGGPPAGNPQTRLERLFLMVTKCHIPKREGKKKEGKKRERERTPRWGERALDNTI